MPLKAAQPQSDSASAHPDHERSDASPRPLVIFLLLLIVGAAVVHALMAWWLQALNRGPAGLDEATTWRPAAQAPAATPIESGVPRLQLAPRRELEAYRAGEQAHLGSYGRITDTGAFVHIPIDRALQWVLRNGLPVWTGTNPAPVIQSPLQLQQQRGSYVPTPPPRRATSSPPQTEARAPGAAGQDGSPLIE